MSRLVIFLEVRMAWDYQKSMLKAWLIEGGGFNQAVERGVMVIVNPKKNHFSRNLEHVSRVEG